MEERSLAKSLVDEDGRMLMARVHEFTLRILGKAKKLLKLLLVKETTHS